MIKLFVASSHVSVMDQVNGELRRNNNTDKREYKLHLSTAGMGTSTHYTTVMLEYTE